MTLLPSGGRTDLYRNVLRLTLMSEESSREDRRPCRVRCRRTVGFDSSSLRPTCHNNSLPETPGRLLDTEIGWPLSSVTPKISFVREPVWT